MSENMGLDGCRFGTPMTPEPFENDNQIPLAPRPRLRLKRRLVSQQRAPPTPQFLASVAAEDVPIPSVEEPEIATFDGNALHSFGSMSHLADDHDMHFTRGRTFSPPKTPAPGSVPSLSPSRYPNWSIDSSFSSCESSPEPQSRPSTSRSVRTSTSSFSIISSCFSDDAHLSPELETSEEGHSNKLHAPGAPRRRAPWTQAMTTHLWATYNLYLSDPRVTPFRIGKSGIPPEGVCKRVAREAIRSWKGSKKTWGERAASACDRQSGSTTPTAEPSGAFMQWPHTGAATRANLKALCKQKARGPDGGKFRYFSRTPTPSTVNQWTQRLTPGQSAAAFQTQDMAMSLALSTSDVMQPEGPLAQLTGSSPEPVGQECLKNLDHIPPPNTDAEPSVNERRCLGSPFHARSYGPSSSASLASVLGPTTGSPQRQTRTVGPRRALQSPVRLSRTSTQKRKTKQSGDARKRPTLGADLWLDPRLGSSAGGTGTGNSRRETMFSSTNTSQHDDLFIPRSQAGLSLTSSFSSPQVTRQLEVPMAPPPRLGSPFSAGISSSSMPNRFTAPDDFWMRSRPFSTQQSRGPHAREPSRVNLATKLAYMDRRLKELNGRDDRRRSESPM